MDPNSINATVTKIWTNPLPELDNMSPEEAIKQKKFSIYVGFTKRTLEEEALRWLTSRGKHLRKGYKYKGGRNNPVLVSKKTERDMDAKEREALGLKTLYVFSHVLKQNGLDVEEGLQRLISNQICDDGKLAPLGLRLHRCISKGSHQQDPDAGKPDYLGKVFLAIAPYENVLKLCKIQY